MRLQTKAVPDADHGALTQPDFLRQRSCTPVCGRRRHALQRLGDSRLHLRIGDPARRAGARIIRQTLHALHAVPLPPFPHCRARYAQLQRDGLIGQSLGSPKNDLRAHRHALGGLGAPRQQRQFLPIRRVQHQGLLVGRPVLMLPPGQTSPGPRIKECSQLLQGISNSEH